MMHTYKSYKTKKAFKEAALDNLAADYLKETSLFGPELSDHSTIIVAGPNEMHKWYASVTVREGMIVKVK